MEFALLGGNWALDSLMSDHFLFILLIISCHYMFSLFLYQFIVASLQDSSCAQITHLQHFLKTGEIRGVDLPHWTVPAKQNVSGLSDNPLIPVLHQTVQCLVSNDSFSYFCIFKTLKRRPWQNPLPHIFIKFSMLPARSHLPLSANEAVLSFFFTFYCFPLLPKHSNFCAIPGFPCSFLIPFNLLTVLALFFIIFSFLCYIYYFFIFFLKAPKESSWFFIFQKTL